MGANQNPEKPKTCFVIAPIGEPGSETRQRSDKVYRHVIGPAARECGYAPIRSDEDPRPGVIGSQVIDRLFDDELVIADLTDFNPNVFYELAIRHATHQPIVQIIQAGQRIPFDLVQQRTIPLDHTDLDSADACRKELIRQIQAVETDPSLVDNPISQARRLKAWEQSPDPNVRRDAEIIGMLQQLNARIDALAVTTASLTQHPIHPIASFDWVAYEAAERFAKDLIGHRFFTMGGSTGVGYAQDLIWKDIDHVIQASIRDGLPLTPEFISDIVDGAIRDNSRFSSQLRTPPSPSDQ
jgi:hypothetical protein